ncbi:MAG: LytR C-terminal domain-containing protein, partial [Dehalococcoidia bacterium]|nr:LytR C-terminal domain-containing protein [Dehalococcoidia bacterium]
IHLPGLFGIAMQRLTTDVEVPGLGDLQQLLTDWRGVKITEAALTAENYLTSEHSTEVAYILSPVPAMADWSQIHALVRVLMEKPELAEEMARTKVIVRDGSGQPEKGKELRARLMAQGFSVAPLESLPLQATTSIADMNDGQSPRLIDALKELLGRADLPVQKAGFPSPRVAIILGQDMAL